MIKNQNITIEAEKPVLTLKSKNRPTGTQILNRRKEMIKFDRLGLKPKEWIPKVAAKFDASEDAVKRDWSNRGKWMNMYFQTTEVQTLGLDTLYDYEIAAQEAAELYYETENPKLKPTTLGLWMKAIKMKHDFFDKFGVLTRLRNQYYEEVKRRRDEDERAREQDIPESTDAYYESEEEGEDEEEYEEEEDESEEEDEDDSEEEEVTETSDALAEETTISTG